MARKVKTVMGYPYELIEDTIFMIIKEFTKSSKNCKTYRGIKNAWFRSYDIINEKRDKSFSEYDFGKILNSTSIAMEKNIGKYIEPTLIFGEALHILEIILGAEIYTFTDDD